ncbi:MAG: hypothetical protein LBF93_02055 [Zoogloeaceae bacterium]|nr:hypothetical protein [Zoogloeaceae bacterium]
MKPENATFKERTNAQVCETGANEMSVSKIGKYWVYPANISSYFSRHEMEKLIEDIDGVSACKYIFCPNSDIYEIEFQHMKFILIVDVDDGYDLRSTSKDSLLDSGKKFMDILEKSIMSRSTDRED